MCTLQKLSFAMQYLTGQTHDWAMADLSLSSPTHVALQLLSAERDCHASGSLSEELALERMQLSSL